MLLAENAVACSGPFTTTTVIAAPLGFCAPSRIPGEAIVKICSRAPNRPSRSLSGRRDRVSPSG